MWKDTYRMDPKIVNFRQVVHLPVVDFLSKKVCFWQVSWWATSVCFCKTDWSIDFNWSQMPWLYPKIVYGALLHGDKTTKNPSPSSPRNWRTHVFKRRPHKMPFGQIFKVGDNAKFRKSGSQEWRSGRVSKVDLKTKRATKVSALFENNDSFLMIPVVVSRKRLLGGQIVFENLTTISGYKFREDNIMDRTLS